MRTLNCTLPPQPSHTTFAAEARRCVEDTLCAYIREHGFPCRLEADGRIRAATYCYYVRVEDVEDTGRKGFWQIDTLEPTLSAVKGVVGLLRLQSAPDVGESLLRCRMGF